MLKLSSNILSYRKKTRKIKMTQIKVGATVIVANTIGYEGSLLQYGDTYIVSKVNKTTLEVKGRTAKFKIFRFLTEDDFYNISKNMPNYKKGDIVTMKLPDSDESITRSVYSVSSRHIYFREKVNGRYKGEARILNKNTFKQMNVELVEFNFPTSFVSKVRIATPEDIAHREKHGIIIQEGDSYVVKGANTKYGSVINRAVLHALQGKEIDLLYEVKRGNELTTGNTPPTMKLKYLKISHEGHKYTLHPNFLVEIEPGGPRFKEEIPALAESKKKERVSKVYIPRIKEEVKLRVARKGFSLDKSYVIKNVTAIKSTGDIIVKLNDDSNKGVYINIKQLMPADKSKYHKIPKEVIYDIDTSQKATMLDWYIAKYVWKSRGYQKPNYATLVGLSDKDFQRAVAKFSKPALKKSVPAGLIFGTDAPQPTIATETQSTVGDIGPYEDVNIFPDNGTNYSVHVNDIIEVLHEEGAIVYSSFDLTYAVPIDSTDVIDEDGDSVNLNNL